MPVIKVQNRALELEAGDEIEAVCSDPGALNDIPAWSRINGHEILETRTDGDEYIIVVKLGTLEG
jgi:tRNA 2-thiouridine synthesizing protein A